MTTETTNAKRIPAVTTRYDFDNGTFYIMFAEGDGFSFQPADLDQRIIEHAVAHGLNAKLVDAAAISRDTTTGKSATVTEKREAVLAVAQRLLAGEWNRPRAAADSATLLLQAMARVFPEATPEALRAKHDAWSDDERKAVRLNPRIARALADIQAERAAAKGLDSDDLLAGLA